MGNSNEIKDYYTILGVSKNATEEEIKSTFKDCAKKYHPDVSKLPNAHERFIEIGEAYEVLSDSRTRRDYDNLLNSKQNNRTGFDRTSESRSYTDFKSTQNKAREQAQYYATMNFDDLITDVLGFVYGIGKTVLVGAKDKPKITLWDYIKLGFSGLVIIICILISFTGIGIIPGIIIAKSTFESLQKDGKFIGIAPLLVSTLVAMIIVIVGFILILKDLFS